MSLTSKPKIYLCFDIGATSVKGAYFDNQENIIIKRTSFLTKKANQKFDLNYLKNNVFIAIKQALLDYEIIAIGIATSGSVDMKTYMINHANKIMVGYLGFNWKNEIQKEFNITTFVANDVKAAGMGEFENFKYESGVMFTLGTGVSVVLFYNNQFYFGSNYMAGEVGQMVWPYNPNLNIDEATSVVIATNKIKTILNNSNIKLSDLDLIKQNMSAFKVWENWIKNIVILIIMLNWIYDSDCYIIGGGISQYNNLVDDLKKYLPSEFNKLILLAKHKNDSAFYGMINYLKMKGY